MLGSGHRDLERLVTSSQLPKTHLSLPGPGVTGVWGSDRDPGASDGAGRNWRREKGAGRELQEKPGTESGPSGEWALLVLAGWGSGEQEPQMASRGPRVKSLVPGWTSLAVQWLRLRLPVQGSRVQSLVQKDPACFRAARPGATTTEAPPQEKLPQGETREPQGGAAPAQPS